MTRKEAMTIFLEDDDTPYGGLAHANETLYEFMQDIFMPFTASLEEINNALVTCGIKPIRK